MNNNYIYYAVASVLEALFFIWFVYLAENAPLYEESSGKYTYKEYVTIFGIKLFKRKK